MDVDIAPCGGCSRVHVVQGKFHVIALIGVDQGVCHLMFGCGDNAQSALADYNLGMAAFIGDEVRDVAPFGGVYKRQAHIGAGYRLARLIGDRNREFDGGAVGRRLVHDDLAAFAREDAAVALEIAAVVGEQARVHQHGASGGGGEPTAVKRLFGLASAQVVPFAIDIRFDPGVVVIAMGPKRGVNLTSGDAVCAQCGDQIG